MDIADWLRRLGLEQYAPAFKENAIGSELLPSLTADDLKDLGVALIGHRRKLLDGIAALRAGGGAPGEEPAPASEHAGGERMAGRAPSGGSSR
jgi:hypothetical protein